MAKKRGIIRTLFGTMLNVDEYVSFNEIKQDSKMVVDTFKEVLNTKINVDTTPGAETFEEALVRMNISKDDLHKKSSLALYYSIFYIAFALSFVMYSIYIFSLAHYIAGLAICALALFMTAYSIRESIMYVQIKTRNFNITAKGWFYSILGIKQKGNANEK